MNLLVILFSFVALVVAEGTVKDSKRTVKRGVVGLGYHGYASGYGYGHYGYYDPVPTYIAPVVTKVSYGYKPYSGYYSDYYGHSLYGYGHSYGYPWYGYYGGLGHGSYGLGHGYYGLGHGYYGLGHGYYGLGHGYHDWW